MNDCLKKRGLSVGQQRRLCMIGMTGGICKGECLRCSSGHKPLNLTRWYSCWLSQLDEALRGGGMSVAKPGD